MAVLLDVNDDESSNIEQLAKNELNDLNKVKRKISCDFVGAINARVNKVIHISDEYTGLDMLMRITEAVHTYANGKYTMNLNMEYVKDAVSNSNVGTKKIQRAVVEDDGESSDGNYSDRASAVINTARKLKGKIRYVFGGNNPNSGMDCSHFVCWAFRNCGYKNKVNNFNYATASGLYYNYSVKVVYP